jgi:hypothetical protein
MPNGTINALVGISEQVQRAGLERIGGVGVRGGLPLYT